ncbi:hypothetical protein HOY80DRAFT_432929 [Tuber brumale]|nr:hypothetical protein HOY80DRAFT_432929 [Tuber brumale]
MANTATTDTLATSPIKERQNSLENALAHRPDQKELEERNILHTGAEISERQQELAKAMAHRPEKDDLVQRNILPHNANVAPALISHQRELEKNLLERDLKEKLSHRPEPREVIQKGILRPDEDPTNPQE